MHIRFSWLFVLASILLAGCGGGSSSGPNSPAAPAPPPAPASARPLGSVSHVQALGSCPAGYAANQCWQATVSCPGTADIQITYGLQQVPGSKGTIVLHGGGQGTMPFAGGIALYAGSGYSLVTLAWATDWEDTGVSTKNVLTAACRPATFFNYIFQNVATTGAKCAEGFSAGSAALAYALAWYGAESYLDKVELVSGPVFSDIAQGCMVPQPAPLTVCPAGQFGCEPGDTFQDSPSYPPGLSIGVGQITGDSSCGGSNPTSSTSNGNWKAMSIVDGTDAPTFAYPNTSVGGWICDNGQNNSAAQGDIFFQQFKSTSQVASLLVVPV